MQRSSTQQTFIDAPIERVWELVGDPNRHPEWWPEMLEVECADLREGCRYRGVVKGPFGAAPHDLVVDRYQDCSEVSIFCDGTGVTTRYALTKAQGGTFVEGCFTIEPNSIGMKVLGAVTGRRFMHSWLESSLENLRSAAGREATATVGLPRHRLVHSAPRTSSVVPQGAGVSDAVCGSPRHTWR